MGSGGFTVGTGGSEWAVPAPTETVLCRTSSAPATISLATIWTVLTLAPTPTGPSGVSIQVSAPDTDWQPWAYPVPLTASPTDVPATVWHGLLASPVPLTAVRPVAVPVPLTAVVPVAVPVPLTAVGP